MTTYSRTFEITRIDLGTLKMMVYREEWTQWIFECLAHAQPVSNIAGKSEETVKVTMRELESIFFEYWLKVNTSKETVVMCLGSIFASYFKLHQSQKYKNNIV